MSKPREVTAWAWKMRGLRNGVIGEGEWLLCKWAEPYRPALKDKPSPEAVAIRVTITPLSKPRTKRKGAK